MCWKLEEHTSIILEGYVGLGREVKYQSSGFADEYVKFAGDKSTVTKEVGAHYEAPNPFAGGLWILMVYGINKQ